VLVQLYLSISLCVPEEDKLKHEVSAIVGAWGMKYSSHGLRAYLGHMHEVFSAFPPSDDAARLSLRKAPASDVRKIYLQVNAEVCLMHSPFTHIVHPFRQTVKHVHPDKLASSSVREQLLGSMVFNLLNEAFISFKTFEGLSK
jgi:hypothetical protein